MDLLYYLLKAYKAAQDNELIVYIKDLESQCDDGRATFTAEDLIVRIKNNYEERLFNEENAWEKPMEEQEKIVAMTAEINSLKKERQGTATKKDKETPGGKKQATKKAPAKKTKELVRELGLAMCFPIFEW